MCYERAIEARLTISLNRNDARNRGSARKLRSRNHHARNFFVSPVAFPRLEAAAQLWKRSRRRLETRRRRRFPGVRGDAGNVEAESHERWNAFARRIKGHAWPCTPWEILSKTRRGHGAEPRGGGEGRGDVNMRCPRCPSCRMSTGSCTPADA